MTICCTVIPTLIHFSHFKLSNTVSHAKPDVSKREKKQKKRFIICRVCESISQSILSHFWPYPTRRRITFVCAVELTVILASTQHWFSVELFLSSDNNNIPDILQELSPTNVVKNGQCNRALSSYGFSVTAKMVCTIDNNAGVCNVSWKII